MRKILLIGTFVGALLNLNAQITLQYQTHALIADTENDMVLTSYTNPGEAGENLTWDFSKLTVKQDFLGQVDKANYMKSTPEFPEANTELQEFNNLFYFDVNENRMLEYGVTNTQNSFTIKYNSPCVKMVFPFEYGQTEAGSYSGEYISGNITRAINGEYLVTADAYGTLILPDVTVENTLRVKTVKEYSRQYSNYTTNIKLVTYRWYNAFERFPLLVLTEITTETNGNTSTTNQAAYRTDVNLGVAASITQVKTDAFLNVFPNPVKKEFSIGFNAIQNEHYNIAVYDLAGKLVSELDNCTYNEGYQELSFNTADLNLQSQTYLIKIESENYNGRQFLIVE